MLFALGAQVVLVLVGYGALVLAHQASFMHPQLDRALWIEGAVNIALIPFLLWVVRRVGDEMTNMSIFRAPQWPDIGTGILAAIAMLVVTDGSGTLIARLSNHPDSDQQIAISILEHAHGFVPIALFAVVGIISAPLFEELLFRGLLFNALRQWTMVPAAIVLSGLAFGFMHFKLEMLIPLALGGMVLAYAYWKSQSIWTSITGHMLFNTVAIAATLIGMK